MKEEIEKERKAISISSTHLSGESVHFMRVHYLFLLLLNVINSDTCCSI